MDSAFMQLCNSNKTCCLYTASLSILNRVTRLFQKIRSLR